MASAFLKIKEKAKLLTNEDVFREIYKIESYVHSMFQKDQFLIFGSKAYVTICNNSSAWKTELVGRFSKSQIHQLAHSLSCFE